MARWLLLMLALLPLGGHAAPITAPHVRVELVADEQSIRPGRDAWLGVRFAPERGWHVYWRNPGDSGEAPTVAWTVPSRLAVGALEWPAPTRIPIGPLANYGYEGETVLPARLDVPADLAGTTGVDVTARVQWLVCNEEECIPGTGTLGLTLPVDAGEPKASAAAPLFEAARARQPTPPPSGWTIGATADEATLSLVVRGIEAPLERPALFFPFGREVVEHAAEQTVTAIDGGFRLDVPRWMPSAALPESIDGILTLGERSYTISASVSGGSRIALEALALAFAGGLLLNLMPCVFPVLALKAFGLIGLARDDRRQARAHGLTYAFGVLASFWALTGVLLAVRAGGEPLGWGFQLQSPIVVAVLAGLFFWMALALLGVTTIGGSLMGVGDRLAAAGGHRGAFFSGVLATIVATPCSAPFMGTALGYALVQPAPLALGVFTALAAGLAFPYVAITFVPAIASHLPRPGRWMETLKELLAFPLLATVVWLTWVASQQGGPSTVAAILTELLLLGLLAWITARWRGGWSRLVAAGVAAASIAAVGTIGVVRDVSVVQAAADGWEPYSTARLDELLRQRRPVFVDFTAAWCVTCQVNERLVLSTPAVRQKMRDAGVTLVRADWTNPDPEITRALQQFGRDGVPLYVLYSGRQEDRPRILPQILTSDLVITELEQLDTRSPS
jgi:DsbC/DsbD-like thiol-disulfide interchange protein/cytochrome c biogenesis protein CcdA